MYDAVILMAGKGSRLNLGYNKILYKINNKEIFKLSLETFLKAKECKHIILVIDELEKDYILNSIKTLSSPKIKIAYGGSTRQESVYNGIKLANSEYVLIHDAARPLVSLDIINKVYECVQEYNSAVVAVKTIDTIKELVDEKLITLDRSRLYNIQTPQALNLKQFLIAHDKALKDGFIATDDVSLLEKYFDISPKIVEGSKNNFKLTTKEDLEYLKYLIGSKNMDYRIGHSHDTHRLGKDRKLILGGIEIKHKYGLIGHSDADCVLHVVCEAILGALGLGDIGTHFPDNDPKYKNMASSFFVEEAVKKMEDLNYKINNLDLIIYIEKPILRPYIEPMKEKIASLLKVDSSLINLKATRREGLGYVGRLEGVSAECVILLSSIM